MKLFILLKMRKAFIFILLSVYFLSWSNEVASQERINLNRDWRYQENDPSGTDSTLHYSRLKPYLLPCANDFIKSGQKHIRPAGNPGGEVAYVKPDFDDSSWRQLNLPHDWAIEGPFNIDYVGATGKLPYWGIRWYRKSFELSPKDTGKQIYLDIDGAMSYSSVWCNGQFVGGWPYGYASYRLDLTPYVKAGKKNTLAIRLDNPDDASRWYPGSGIYRNVWLVKTSPVHVAQWGTFIRNKEISTDKAVMDMTLQLENNTGKSVQASVKTDIYEQDETGNPKGTKVASCPAMKVKIEQQATTELQSGFVVPNPKLWEIESPACYVAVTRIEVDGREVERYQTPFGIREIEFTHDQGFMLNGRKVPIK